MRKFQAENEIRAGTIEIGASCSWALIRSKSSFSSKRSTCNPIWISWVSWKLKLYSLSANRTISYFLSLRTLPSGRTHAPIGSLTYCTSSGSLWSKLRLSIPALESMLTCSFISSSLIKFLELCKDKLVLMELMDDDKRRLV